MANNFTINKQEYLFKLIPDLSVFDVVERYFIDNNYFRSRKKSNKRSVLLF